MFKSTIATLAAAAAFAAPGAAPSGPYVNIEANAGWTGDDYTETTTDAHVGAMKVLWVTLVLPTTSKVALLLSLQTVKSFSTRFSGNKASACCD